MGSGTSLLSRQDTGLLAGFHNLLRKDCGEWWGTRWWLLHLILWTTLIGGCVAIRLLRDAEPAMIVDTYTFATGFLTSVAIVVVMQDAIVGERESGTASWVLSKPVSRAAFVLSKLAASGASLFLIVIVVQGMLTYGAVKAAGGAPTVGNWVAGMALLSLNLTFSLTLTLMLGTLFTHRGPVVGIPIAVLVGSYVITRVVPGAAQFVPLALVFQLEHVSQTPLATAVMLGRPSTMVLPVVATIVWSVLFTATAIWRFHREEL